MKHITRLFRGLLAALCIVALLSLSACDDFDSAKNDALAEDIIISALENNRSAGYYYIREAFDFDYNKVSEQWNIMQDSLRGSESCDIERLSVDVRMTDETRICKTKYMLSFDNGTSALLYISTDEDSPGAISFEFCDLSDFLAETDSYVPALNVVLHIISILFLVFSIWMVVDCVRRRLKRKWLWFILIFCGVSLTVTFGETFGLYAFSGLMLQASKITAEAEIMSVTLTVAAPIGSFIYFFLRKKFTVKAPDANPETVDNNQDFNNT